MNYPEIVNKVIRLIEDKFLDEIDTKIRDKDWVTKTLYLFQCDSFRQYAEKAEEVLIKQAELISPKKQWNISAFVGKLASSNWSKKIDEQKRLIDYQRRPYTGSLFGD